MGFARKFAIIEYPWVWRLFHFSVPILIELLFLFASLPAIQGEQRATQRPCPS